ncbi:MAG: HAD-IA family hydrolase [Betaproteobacteria bacterium]
MKNYQLIIFDWDGTLMDSTAAIVRAIQAASRDLGLPEPSDRQARHVIGLGLVEALGVAVPELPQTRYPEMVERYRHHYLSSDHQLVLFEGIELLMSELAARDHLLAVATGKSRNGLDRALSRSGLGAFFHSTRCADECFSKPHPQMLHELMDELGVAPERTLMIGDTSHDLLMAKNAGVDALGVTYGAHLHDHLMEHSPLACLGTVAALRAWLKTNA